MARVSLFLRTAAMSSRALQTWNTTAGRALDQIVAAHAAVGGRAPGRRYATQEINHAYAVLLSSQFQRFCRDLHTEAIDHIVASVPSALLREVLRDRLADNRRLDHGNPNPANLGADFGRLGFAFWPILQHRDRRNTRRRRQLEELAAWRNAIAHHDFGSGVLSPAPPLRLAHVHAWRSACSAIAVEIERVVAERLMALVGSTPW